MIAPTTRPARISQPTLLRQRSHALANTSPIVKVPPRLVVGTRGTREAIPREFAREACYPCFRHARLDPQGVPQVGRHGGRRRVAGGHGLRDAACGGPAQRRPPLLPAPRPPGRQADEAGPRRRARRQPRRHHRRGRRRPRRHGGVRQEGRRRHRQAQHLHRLPRSRVRGDHQPRRRRDPGLPVPPGRSRPRARHGPPLRRPGRGGLPRERDPGRGGEGRRRDAAHVRRRLSHLPHPRGPRPHVVADLLGRALVRRPDRRADRQGPRHDAAQPRRQEPPRRHPRRRRHPHQHRPAHGRPRQRVPPHAHRRRRRAGPHGQRTHGRRPRRRRAARHGAGERGHRRRRLVSRRRSSTSPAPTSRTCRPPTTWAWARWTSRRSTVRTVKV